MDIQIDQIDRQTDRKIAKKLTSRQKYNYQPTHDIEVAKSY